MDLIICILKPVTFSRSVYSYKEQGSFQDTVNLKAHSKQHCAQLSVYSSLRFNFMPLEAN